MIEDTAPVTGHDLAAWGHRPGPAFPRLIATANARLADGMPREAVRALLAAELPPPPPPALRLRPAGSVPFTLNIEAETEDEAKNVAAVEVTMTELMRTPTIVAGAVMPDACPAGPPGTIPVGGVVAAENAIHPGMHSADVCCSVMMTDLGRADPAAVLDAAHAATHFGPGGRRPGVELGVAADLLAAFDANPFLAGPKMRATALSHMGTQGDGNHFLSVGRSEATGRTAIVTHHGSRGVGALLHRAGMETAERFRLALSPETAKGNAWIPADTDEGRAYWEALQLVRAWTKLNHAVLHDRTAAALGMEPVGRVWNEHNFVFRRDGLFFHGKGATPAFEGYADDASGLTLIPLNMAEPVLVTRGRDAGHALGFSPHGAGRNFSRTEHRRRMGGRTPESLLAEETAGLDVRFFCGRVDASELPSSYKRADAVVRQIERYGLATVVDRILPYGCIMAGDVPAPWRERKRAQDG